MAYAGAHAAFVVSEEVRESDCASAFACVGSSVTFGLVVGSILVISAYCPF